MLKNILIQKVFAEVDFNDADSFESNLFKDKELGQIFEIVANIIIYVGLGLVLIFLAMGFIKFITSQGDKVATEQAQKWLTYAIIGGVGLLCVYAIRAIILQVVGVEV